MTSDENKLLKVSLNTLISDSITPELIEDLKMNVFQPTLREIKTHAANTIFNFLINLDNNIDCLSYRIYLLEQKLNKEL